MQLWSRQVTTIIEEIKQRIKLTDLVGETFSISGKGRILTTVEHDSLKLWVNDNRWWWFSRSVGGDVLDWWQHIHRCDLHTAIDDLARKAAIERRPSTPAEIEQRHAAAQSTLILQIAAAWYAARLPEHSPAWNYCTARGWTEATIKREAIGYNPTPSSPSHNNSDTPLSTLLRNANLLDHPLAKAVLSIPPDMLVYVHRQHGRPIYLSARSITAKRHWNLPADLAGGKQLYHNHPPPPPPPPPNR
jgi:DNA primase